jgi:hypothetical protein
MLEADLAARGQGAAGLTGPLTKQPAALGGRQQPLVDLAVVKVRDQELAAVPLARHEFHGEWNYTIRPAA